MLHCNHAIMPMLSITKLSTYTKLKEIDVTLYKTIIGKLIFLTNTKPEITFVVGVVSRYIIRP